MKKLILILLLFGCSTPKHQPLQDKATQIIESANVIESHTEQKEIRKETKTIKKVAKSLDSESELIVDLQAEITELRSVEKERMVTLWTTVITISLLCLASGVGLTIYSQNLLGLTLIGTALAMIVVAYTMLHYFMWIATGGLVLLGLIAIHLAQKYLSTKDALVDSVSTVEIIKGDGAWDPNIIKKIQKPASKKIIKQIKDTVVNK